jgi:hypothetical protein
MFVIGLDIGQAADYSAVCVVENVIERLEENDDRGMPQYKRFMDVRHAQRFPLQTSYPAVVESVDKLNQTPQLGGKARYVVDATGVGRPIIDMMRKEKMKPFPVVITSGLKESYSEDDGYWHVPKRVLISNLQLLFGSNVLRFADTLQYQDIIKKELLNFRMKISTKGNDSYEAWREADHDDLVLSVAIAAWYLGKFGQSKPKVKTTWVSPLEGLKYI